MKRTERQALLTVIETAAKCHQVLTYWCNTTNQEQRESALIHLSQLHGLLAKSFQPFQKDIAIGILERNVEEVEKRLYAEFEKEIENIDSSVNNRPPFYQRYEKELKQIETLTLKYMSLKDRLTIMKDKSAMKEFVRVRKQLDAIVRTLPQQEFQEWCNTPEPDDDQGDEWKKG